MYKLLLVTDNQKILDAFSGVPSWPLLGFKEPRTVSDTESAFSVMDKHHVDAVILGLDEDNRAIFIEKMNEKPLLPILLAEDIDSTDKALLNLDMVCSLLNRLHADYSNDRYNTTEMMQLCRHEYFRKILTGEVRDELTLRKTLLLLRSKMNPYAPCLIMELTILNDEDFLNELANGADRLEVAMRNIFGAEKEGMRVLVSVLDDKRIILTACPMIGTEIQDEDVMYKLVKEHAIAGIQHVKEFLGIHLEIASIQMRSSLITLAQKSA